MAVQIARKLLLLWSSICQETAYIGNKLLDFKCNYIGCCWVGIPREYAFLVSKDKNGLKIQDCKNMLLLWISFCLGFSYNKSRSIGSLGGDGWGIFLFSMRQWKRTFLNHSWVCLLWPCNRLQVKRHQGGYFSGHWDGEMVDFRPLAKRTPNPKIFFRWNSSLHPLKAHYSFFFNLQNLLNKS